jgi:hypothetical protein
MARGTAFLIISIFFFLAFVIFALGFVFSRGVCCADDAHQAEIAKNMASGLGYATTTQSSKAHYEPTLFDPKVGTGPVIKLPTALFIKLFGNTYWAPGLVGVFIWASLLLSIGILLHQLFGSEANFMFATLFFLYLSYVFTTYHFEQWYALLGEIPAAFLIILAVLVYLQINSKKSFFISGILFSLAVYTKFIALLVFTSFIIIIAILKLVDHFSEPKNAIRIIFYELAYICLGFFSVFFIMESWKAISLFMAGESINENWQEYLNFVRNKGAATDVLNLSQFIDTRIGTAYERFGIFLPALVLFFIGIGFLIRKEKILLRLFVILTFIISAYSIYWIFFSIGWARYYIISLIIICFVLILPFNATDQSRKVILLYSCILILLATLNWKRIEFPLRNLQGRLFSPTVNTQSLIEVGEILDSHPDERPVITQWWGTATDIEYIMKTNLNFTTFHDPDINLNEPYILAINTRFIYEEDELFPELISECSNIKSIGNYKIGFCESGQ